MKRNYKLAANYNVVELEFSDEDLKVYATEDEIDYEYMEDVDDYVPVITTPQTELIKRMLQREYDILASINTVGAPAAKPAAPVEKPSAKMIEWATNLGMIDADKRSKQEVWSYIQKHKG